MSSDQGIDALLAAAFAPASKETNYQEGMASLADEVIRLRAKLLVAERERAAYLDALNSEQQQRIQQEVLAAQLLHVVPKGKLATLPWQIRMAAISYGGSVWEEHAGVTARRRPKKRGRRPDVHNIDAMEKHSAYLDSIKSSRAKKKTLKEAIHEEWTKNNPGAGQYRFSKQYPALRKRHQRLSAKLGQ